MAVLLRLREVPPRKLLLLLRAFALLLLARFALALLPVRIILRRRQNRLRAPAAGDQAACRRDVRWAVLVASRYSPLRFVCFPQCLAASALLARQGVPSRLHYGVTRSAAKLETHTWLEAGGEIVIGGEVAGEFSTLAIY